MASRVGGGRGTILAKLSDVVGQPEVLVDENEIMSYGDTWHVLSAAAAALTAVPGTTAGLSLWSGEAANGRWYHIDSIGAVEIVVDSTQQNMLAMFAMMTKGAYAEAADSGLVKGSMSGRSNYGGAAKTYVGATVVDHVWTPVGPSGPGSAAVAGGAWRVTDIDVRARGWFVAPGGLFSIACAKIAATASQIRYFIRWREVPRVR